MASVELMAQVSSKTIFARFSHFLSALLTNSVLVVRLCIRT